MNTFKKSTGLLLLTPIILTTVFFIIDLFMFIIGGDSIFRTADDIGPYGTAGIAGALLLFNTKNKEK